jgi:general secretion pathway protein G
MNTPNLTQSRGTYWILMVINNQIRWIDYLPLQGLITCKSWGYTLIELMIVVAIIGTLASIATPLYLEHVDKARITRAIAEIKQISMVIDAYRVDHDKLPLSLDEVEYKNFLDPWGNPYQYLNIEIQRGFGNVRKDRFLVPLNSDYDLYSKGKDGDSRSPLTARVSRDDIVRANNGMYIGLAFLY